MVDLPGPPNFKKCVYAAALPPNVTPDTETPAKVVLIKLPPPAPCNKYTYGCSVYPVLVPEVVARETPVTAPAATVTVPVA